MLVADPAVRPRRAAAAQGTAAWPGGASSLPAPAGGTVRQLEVRLQGSADWEGLVARADRPAPSGSTCVTVRFNVNAPALQEGYHARWDSPGRRDRGASRLWRAEMPLAVGGQTVGRLEITGRRDDEPCLAEDRRRGETDRGSLRTTVYALLPAWPPLADAEPAAACSAPATTGAAPHADRHLSAAAGNAVGTP